MQSSSSVDALGIGPTFFTASQVPFRDEWKIDVTPSATGWVMAQLETRSNSGALHNPLASFAGGGGTSGEVGILKRILEIVGEENRWCCEFGANDGVASCNTIELVGERGWNAVYIEPGPTFAQLEALYRGRDQVHTLKRFVGFEGGDRLDAILADTPCPTGLDVMIIDVDGCDYHIWSAIEIYRARVVVIEFNATIPHDVSFIQPRDPAIKQGSSLLAMTELARSRGYELVATTLWNAFFVQRELYPSFELAENHPAAMHRSGMTMPLFQLYDGTLVLGGWSALNWMDLRLGLEDIQVLPKGLRRHVPALAKSPVLLLPDGGYEAASPWWMLGPAEAPANLFGREARNQYSFYGDDGIIAALLRALELPPGRFLDVGSGGVREGSRVWALSEAGWSGHVVRLAEDRMADPSGVEPMPNGVTVLEAPRIEFHDIRGFLQPLVALEHVDLLSVGISGADYQLWQALYWLEPTILAIQFNPTIPNDIFFVQAPDSGVHQGCSLHALIDLGRRFGYELAACSLATAFFVPKDIWPQLGLPDGDIDDMHVPRFSMRLFQLYDGTLKLDGLRQLLWHGIIIDEDAIQVLPKALRHWPAMVPSDAHRALYPEVA